MDTLVYMKSTPVLSEMMLTNRSGLEKGIHVLPIKQSSLYVYKNVFVI